MKIEHTPKPSAYHSKTVGTSVVQVCSASPDRRALVFSAHTGVIWVSPNASMTAGQGLCVPKDGAPTEVCACHQGQWVTMALYAIADTASSVLYTIEGFEDVWPVNNLSSY